MVRHHCVSSSALLEHAANVGEHCHISTVAILNCTMMIGSGSFICSGRVILFGGKVY